MAPTVRRKLCTAESAHTITYRKHHLQVVNGVEREKTGIRRHVDGGAERGGSGVGNTYAVLAWLFSVSLWRMQTHTHGAGSGDLSIGLFALSVPEDLIKSVARLTTPAMTAAAPRRTVESIVAEMKEVGRDEGGEEGG